MVEPKLESLSGDQDCVMCVVRVMSCRVDDGGIGAILHRSCSQELLIWSSWSSIGYLSFYLVLSHSNPDS